MKLFFPLMIGLLLLSTSCEKPVQDSMTRCLEVFEEPNPSIDSISIRNEELCLKYFDIWKELFLERNNLNEDFFNNHIEVVKTRLHSWRDGISFAVSYNINIGWASAREGDKFIIHIIDEEGLYPTLDLPRNTDLNKSQIALAVDHFAFSSRIRPIENTNVLIAPTQESAIQSLLEVSSVSELCFNKVKLNWRTGHLELIAFAEYVGGDNECVRGTIDLIDGSLEVVDVVCAIIN